MRRAAEGERWIARFLVLACGATAFLLCVVAVRDHAALRRAGYSLTRLEREAGDLGQETARLRERIGRLASPAVLAQRADSLGLGPGYPDDFSVVRMILPGAAGPWLARGEGAAGR